MGTSKSKSKPVYFAYHNDMLKFLHVQWLALQAKHDSVVGHKGLTFKRANVVDDPSLQELFRLIGNLPDAHLYVNSCLEYGSCGWKLSKKKKLSRLVDQSQLPTKWLLEGWRVGSHKSQHQHENQYFRHWYDYFSSWCFDSWIGKIIARRLVNDDLKAVSGATLCSREHPLLASGWDATSANIALPKLLSARDSRALHCCTKFWEAPGALPRRSRCTRWDRTQRNRLDRDLKCR